MGMGVFMQACSSGGDALHPSTSTFAGLFLGLLDDQVRPEAAVLALQVLLDAGLDVNGPLTSGGLWPLHAAVRRGSEHLAESLLAALACPHALNAQGRTPLDVARAANSQAAVTQLCKATQRWHARRR